MSYRFADSLRAGSGRNWFGSAADPNQFRPDPARKLSTNLYDIYHCCVYSEKPPDDRQRNCPKHVEFYSKNKFEKQVHIFGCIIRIYHDAGSPERLTPAAHFAGEISPQAGVVAEQC